MRIDAQSIFKTFYNREIFLQIMNIYEKAARAVRDRRRADLDEGRLIWQDALARDDALYKAFVAYQAEMIKNAKREPNEIEKARERVLQNMKRLGIGSETVEPSPRCKLCGDTGTIGGKYCKCVKNSAIAANDGNLMLPHADFETAKKTAPKAIAGVYKLAEKYIDAFPSGKPTLLLSGSSGSGKTVLASAVAAAFMERGASAVTVTAFGFVRRALDYHTQFSIPDYTDGFTPMLDCDLLVIDDLGTENTLKNVTKEYLYTVINERWIRGKHTLITTNLDAKSIMTRYGESIASRLFDKNKSQLCLIEGKNDRLN